MFRHLEEYPSPCCFLLSNTSWKIQSLNKSRLWCKLFCYWISFFHWTVRVFADRLYSRSCMLKACMFFLCLICTTYVDLENCGRQMLAHSHQPLPMSAMSRSCWLNSEVNWQLHSSHGVKRNSVCCLLLSLWRNSLHRSTQTAVLVFRTDDLYF